jgi:uncharacterized DUF497 family protein
MVFVRRLNWDSWNLEHIARHGVTQDEVEAVCHGDPIELKRSYKDRFLVAGPTPAGRILTVVLGPVPEAAAGVYYVFTARPAHRSERRYYHHQKGGSQP